MVISSGVLPPPVGLDAGEIATDNGLRRAIKREADKFRNAEKHRRKISRDEIRLIIFLTDEMQRRFDLNKEEEAELQVIRDKAYQRDIERAVDEIVLDINTFVDNALRPHAEIPFSRINELGASLQVMLDSFSREADLPAKLIDRLEHARTMLEDIEKRGIRGFENFQAPTSPTE